MVETAVLDGIAPPSATKVLDAAYVASSGREVIGRILADCKLDPVCATQFDLGDAIANLSRDNRDASERPSSRRVASGIRCR
jgi:hypothetical protein